MTLRETINKEFEDTKIIWEDDETIDEAKVVTPLDYKRHWHEFSKDEVHYSKKTGKRLYGCWIYDHRAAAGASYGDGKIVHHKDHDKKNNSKSNLSKISQSEHCKIDPNSRKHFKCKVCGKPHYAKGFCLNCYMKKYRKSN